MESVKEKTTHQKLLDVINSLTQDEVDFFQKLFDDLPEDDVSMSDMEEACIEKVNELGIEQHLFEKLVMFYFGFDQAVEVV